MSKLRSRNILKKYLKYLALLSYALLSTKVRTQVLLKYKYTRTHLNFQIEE